MQKNLPPSREQAWGSLLEHERHVVLPTHPQSIVGKLPEVGGRPSLTRQPPTNTSDDGDI